MKCGVLMLLMAAGWVTAGLLEKQASALEIITIEDVKQQKIPVTALVKAIEASGAPAIFLETGANTDLARQVADETGVKLVTDLYTHSLEDDAPTYLDMMRWNVNRIVEAVR